MAPPALNRPPNPGVTADEYDKEDWKGEMKIYQCRKECLEENMPKLWHLIWGQCSKLMCQRLQALDDFKAQQMAGDSIGLLKAIKQISFNFESQNHGTDALIDALDQFHTFRQLPSMSTQAYFDGFTNIIEVVTYCGGTVGQYKSQLKLLANERGQDLLTISDADVKILQNDSHERFLAVKFLKGSDERRFGALVNDIKNAHLHGTNHYPNTVTGAFGLLTSWISNTKPQFNPGGTGVAFTNVDGAGVALATAGRPKKDVDKSTIECFNCHEMGHYSNECPTRRQSGEQLLLAAIETDEFNNSLNFAFLYSGTHHDGTSTAATLHGTVHNNNHGAQIPNTWILLDNQSTVDVFHSEKLLTNIRVAPGYMDIHCNAGVTSTNLIGDLDGYGTVWYQPKGIANILSLTKVSEKYLVTYNSREGDAFVVHKEDGTTRTFKKSPRGLFFMDAATTGTLLVNTVAENKSKYSNRDYSQAVLARKIQQTIGRPGTKAFMKIVSNKLLPNCPITYDDIVAAKHIFGPDIGSLKGKTVHRPGERVDARTATIPPVLMSRYPDIVLGADIMFVNKIPFFMSISRNIRFCTSEALKNQSGKTILGSIKLIKRLYATRGLRITQMVMDGQFENLRADLADMQIVLNTTSNDEHVPDIERHIRTMKERVRSTYNMLPFKKMPQRLVIEMVSASTFWWNSFPPEGGVSETGSPWAIVTGMEIDYTTLPTGVRNIHTGT